MICTGVDRRDLVLKKFASVNGAQLTNLWDGESIPMIVGNNNGNDEIQRKCLKEGKSWIYIDHAYFNRTAPMLDSFRLCVNGFHCNDWRDSDRVPDTKVRPWREGKGEDVVVILPARKEWTIFPIQEWLDEVKDCLPKHTDRRIIYKEKGNGDLLKCLEKAWCVVCSGSVADVDAIRYGVPAICNKFSPVWPIAQHDLSQVESPIYPDRQKWLRSLAASEWRQDEVDLAWERIKCLLPL